MINETTFELVEKMSSIKGNGSRGQKETILIEHKDVLQDYMSICFDVYRIFHINKLPKKSEPLGGNTHYDIPANLTTLARYLENQKGGTNFNRNFTRCFLEHQSPLASKWAEAAILKKVKIGLEVKTLNKCGYNIPTFDLLLAAPNKDNSLEGTTYPAYVEPKLDGVRCVRMPNGTFLGRNGKPVPNIQINNYIQIDKEFKDYVLDGEFFSFSRKFNSIIGIFSREDEQIPKDVKFVVFNVIHKDEWSQQKCTKLYSDQLSLINKISKGLTTNNIVCIPYKLVNSQEEVMKNYRTYLLEGFEGAMIRNTDTTYSWKRTKVKDGILTKIKPFDFADCIIVGYYKGEGRNAERLGGFYLDYNGVQVKCGGGFSDEMREDFYNNREDFIGKICRIKYTEITEDFNLRFPIWDSLRDVK